MITISNPNADWQTTRTVNAFNEDIKKGKYPNMDFTISLYVNKEAPIEVWCTKHDTTFNAKLADIRNGKRLGCVECSLENSRDKIREGYETRCLSVSAWIPLDSYVDSGTKLRHECLCCGDIQTFLPVQVSSNVNRCAMQRGDDESASWMKKQSEYVLWVEEAPMRAKRKKQAKKELMKKSKVNYDLFLKESTSLTRISKYKGMMSKCKFHCSICNRSHKRRCNDVKDALLRKSNTEENTGCKLCNFMNSKGGDYYDEPTTLYYIKVGNLYKIGITIRTIEERFASEGIDYEVISSKLYKTGKKAFKKEQKILKKYIKYRYYGQKVMKYSGNSELFTHDVLGLDHVL